MRHVVLVLLLAFGGCGVGELDLEDRECPCIRGWVCNETIDRCVPDIEREFAPVIVADAEIEHGRGDLRVAAGERWVVDGDTGGVTTRDGGVVRPPGAGIDEGIGWQTLDGPNVSVFSFESLTIEHGAEVVLGGGQPVALLAVTDVTVDGVLSAGAERVAGRPGPGGRSGATYMRIPEPADEPGEGGSARSAGAGGSFGGCGHLGGDATAFPSGPASAPFAAELEPDVLVGGAGGGAGGAGSNNACSYLNYPEMRGGHGGGVLLVSAGHALYVGPRGSIDARGGGGSGGALPILTGSEPDPGPVLFGIGGGAGGGAGGMLVLEAPVLQIAGAVTANGGGGGAGAGATTADWAEAEKLAAGGAGAHGSTGAAPAAGGTGTLGGGDGGAGSGLDGCGAAGHAPAGDGTGRPGGGGGGAGVIHLRSEGDLADVLLASALVSPATTTGLVAHSELETELPVVTPEPSCECPEPGLPAAPEDCS